MPNKPQGLLGKFLVWRARHISQQQFILLLSILVGFLTGLAAVTLKNSTHFVQGFLQSDFVGSYFNLYYFAFPVVGIGLTLLVKYFIKGRVGEGIPSTLFAISRRQGFIKPFKMYASLITSMLTVGFGGSVGLEGPTVSTGSAIGSNLGRLMHVNYKQRILLISCATAGAIASIFNAPIAAIIFTIEIFSLDLTFSSLIPLLLASVSGAVTSIFIEGNDYLFHYKFIAPFAVEDLPFYILLGVLSALVSVYFNKMYFFIEGQFNRFNSRAHKMLVGSLALGLIIWIIPPLYGEGYETINHLLNGNIENIIDQSLLFSYVQSEYMVIGLLLGLVLFKIFATTFTIGAGGVGGIFAPSLFVGSSMGYLFARLVNQIGFFSINTTNFSLIGMAGLMAGVLHAPLTAIFMIAEITGGYELFIPLMLVSAISFQITRQIMPHSIYTTQLAARGDLLTHDKDQAILTLLSINNVVEKDFKRVQSHMNLGQLVKVVAQSRRNLFPVLDEEEKLVGVLTLDDFRHLMFDQNLYEDTLVSELMSPPPALVQQDESMSEVMKKFQSTNAWNLPVVKEEKYVGFVSKSKLFSVYRRKLIEFS
jgi:CIC family chloride channel protein